MKSIPTPFRLSPLWTKGLSWFFRGCGALCLSAAMAAPEAADTASTGQDEPLKVPQVQRLGENRYRLGEIEFNSKTREIRVPAEVNLQQGLVEYYLVHETGKIHESVFCTKVRPLELQMVLKLCRYQEGEGDLFDVFYPDEERKEREKQERARGEAIAIEVQWEKDGQTVTHPGASCVRNLARSAPMTDGPWIYTGSVVDQGDFIAEIEGSIVAVYLDIYAMLNSPREGAEDDERWVSNAEILPDIGTPVVVLMKPVSELPK